MTAVIMDGSVLRREMVAAIRAELAAAPAPAPPAPGLATVVVGDNPRCHIFARDKRAAAEDAGLRTVSIDLAASATPTEVEEVLGRLGVDPEVDGIFVQLPLPGHLDLDRAARLVPPAKDIDALRPDSPHSRTTPLAVVSLLGRYGITIAGRRAVVVGPAPGMARLLTTRGARVTTTDDPSPETCREADILVVAAGRPRSIGPGHIRTGAAVVDLSGAVDADGVGAIADAIAPYPAAVGPVAIACLLRNTLDAAKLGAMTADR